HQPGSTLSRWFHERVGDRRGKFRRITIVAVARKLLIALWRYVTLGLVPEGAELKVYRRAGAGCRPRRHVNRQREPRSARPRRPEAWPDGHRHAGRYRTRPGHR